MDEGQGQEEELRIHADDFYDNRYTQGPYYSQNYGRRADSGLHWISRRLTPCEMADGMSTITDPPSRHHPIVLP